MVAGHEYSVRIAPAEPRAARLAFVAAHPLEQYISIVTLGEIRFGIELVNEPNRRVELNDRLANKVRPMFDGRILAVTDDVMLTWRILVEKGRKVGHTFPQPDLIIAAGVPVINPWDA